MTATELLHHKFDWELELEPEHTPGELFDDTLEAMEALA